MFLRYTKFEQLVFKLEKIVGFRNMQEKLENNHLKLILLLEIFNYLYKSKLKYVQFVKQGNPSKSHVTRQLSATSTRAAYKYRPRVEKNSFAHFSPQGLNRRHFNLLRAPHRLPPPPPCGEISSSSASCPSRSSPAP